MMVVVRTSNREDVAAALERCRRAAKAVHASLEGLDAADLDLERWLDERAAMGERLAEFSLGR
jgi:hypothetical protein